MNATPVDPRIIGYYSDSYDEDLRLRRRPSGRVELLRTQELLRRHLPDQPAEVVDVGGGTGVHAEWLAADGHSVRLLDPVPSHVEQASQITGVDAVVGSADALPYDDDSADAALLLGPLYHLPAAEDRACALREAVRTTRPDGLVAAAGISRFSWFLELSAFGAFDDDTEAEVSEMLATGVNRPELGFTVAYFHTPDELRDELVSAGLTDVVVYGVEGPSIPVLLTLPPEVAEARVGSVVQAARLVELDPALIASSPHFLAVGRVPRG